MPYALTTLLLLWAALLGLSDQARAITYSYDAAGQLVGADYGYGQTMTCQYDPAGNLSWRQATAYSPDGDGVDDAFKAGMTSLPSFDGGAAFSVGNVFGVSLFNMMSARMIVFLADGVR